MMMKTLLPHGVQSKFNIPEGIPMTSFETADQIKVIREPTVYLIGTQRINEAELDRFLGDHGVAWRRIRKSRAST